MDRPMGESVLVSDRLQMLAASGVALGALHATEEVARVTAARGEAMGFSCAVALNFPHDHQVLLPDGTRIDALNANPYAAAIRTNAELGVDGLWVLPLRVGDQMLGALSAAAVPALGDVKKGELRVLAQMCAGALERIRLDLAERQVRAEAYRIYGQLETLARAGAMVSTSRDVDATVRTVVALPLSEFADGCIFEAMDDDLPFIEVAHTDPVQEQAIREFFGSEPSYKNRALAEWVRDATDPLMLDVVPGFWQATNPSQTAPLALMKMRSLIIVPLQERGHHIGLLMFVRMNEPYEDADVPFAAELSRRLSSALENARLYDEAHRAVALRDDFISIAAHELKTPLAALQMRLNMLVGKAEGTPVEASAIRCESYARDLSALVNQLLDVTRMAAGQIRLDLEPVDIVRVVQEVVSRYGDLALQAGTSVRLALPVRLVGVWDRIKLEQVVGNLLANSIKYGQGEPISISVTANDNVCELIVRDRGGGIAPEEQSRIFRRFHRVTTSGGGFGLGLWIVKQVVEAHRGTVAVDSDLGVGATFTVTLPLAR